MKQWLGLTQSEESNGLLVSPQLPLNCSEPDISIGNPVGQFWTCKFIFADEAWDVHSHCLLWKILQGPHPCIDILGHRFYRRSLCCWSTLFSQVTSISSWFIPHVYGWIVLFVKCPWDEIPKFCDPSSSFQYPGTRSPSPCLAPPGAVLLGHGLRFPATASGGVARWA